MVENLVEREGSVNGKVQMASRLVCEARLRPSSHARRQGLGWPRAIEIHMRRPVAARLRNSSPLPPLSPTPPLLPSCLLLDHSRFSGVSQPTFAGINFDHGAKIKTARYRLYIYIIDFINYKMRRTGDSLETREAIIGFARKGFSL